MKLETKDRELLISLIIFLLSLAFLGFCFTIPVSGPFVLSARLLPLLLSVIFIILSVVYVINSYRKGGRLSATKIKGAFLATIKDQDSKRVVINILIIGLLIFVGIPLLGFFISGGIFLFLILLLRVKKIKPLYSLLITCITIAAIHGLFVDLFKLQIK